MSKFQDYLEFLISGVRVRNPSMDTSPGSPVRTLLDPTAEMAAQADIAEDRVGDWNIDNKSGLELDNFTSIFGFTRIPAKHATGNVTLSFATNTTRDYIIPEGTKLYSRRGRSLFTYQTTTAIGIPRYSSYQILPIISEQPGAPFNARAGEVRTLDFTIEQLILTTNEKPVTGGKGRETDEEYRARFRSDLFRNRLGSAAWYKSLASRHNSVSSIQLIQPTQEAEEYLLVEKKQVACQEDSLKFTYPNSFGVYHNRTNTWLEENRDYLVLIDNDTPNPPRIEFVNNAIVNGDNVMVRYRYCSTKSRNNPKNNVLGYLDMYVLGSSPSPVIDYATWPPQNNFGLGTITKDTHPEGTDGLPYHIFVRQPIVEIPNEITVGGRSYFVGKDYRLIKDRGLNANSTRAKDILEWLTTVPTSQRNPGFNVSYFHEAVVSDIQEVVSLPDMHTAVDDVLIHTADRISFDINIFVEWERGVSNDESVRTAIQNYFANIPMGTKIRIGGLIRAISQPSSVSSVFLKEPNITSEIVIRGRRSWNFDVPIPDGSIPVLGNVNITTTASNIYQ